MPLRSDLTAPPGCADQRPPDLPEGCWFGALTRHYVERRGPQPSAPDSLAWLRPAVADFNAAWAASNQAVTDSVIRRTPWLPFSACGLICPLRQTDLRNGIRLARVRLAPFPSGRGDRSPALALILRGARHANTVSHDRSCGPSWYPGVVADDRDATAHCWSPSSPTTRRAIPGPAFVTAHGAIPGTASTARSLPA
jgi:hypothetical protein